MISDIVKPCIIFNPIAGSVANRDKILTQLRRLKPVEIRETKATGDAAKFAVEAVRQGQKYIVSAGGDGTLNEVVNGIGEHANDVRVGILPLGTGNDFAGSLGLPASVAENLRVLRLQRTKRIDLVRVKSDSIRYFVNVSAGGFSSVVDDKLTPQIKQQWGSLSYIRSAAAALPKLHAYHTTVVFDDDRRVEMDLYNVVVANGSFVAGRLPIAPQADPTDSWLDVVLIPKQAAPKMVLLAAQIILGKHLSTGAVIFRRARKIALRSRPKMWFNADGELVGKAPVEFQIIPRAMRFVVNSP